MGNHDVMMCVMEENSAGVVDEWEKRELVERSQYIWHDFRKRCHRIADDYEFFVELFGSDPALSYDAIVLLALIESESSSASRRGA